MALFSANDKSFRERKIRFVLQEYFKIKPKNLQLYYSAVVHSSYNPGEESGREYERLEFLGYALLGAFVAERLYRTFDTKNEGELSRLRSKLISRKFLNGLAFKLHVNHLIYFSTRESLSENSIPGNSLEALIGAIYLDLGPAVLHKTLDHIFALHVNINKVEKQEVDYKSRLVQYCQKARVKPQFKVLNQEHKKGRDYFTIELQVNGQEAISAQGYSKKKAEQLASQLMLEQIQNQETE